MSLEERRRTVHDREPPQGERPTTRPVRTWTESERQVERQRDLAEETLSRVEAERIEAIRERDEARALAADYRWETIEQDDDPEEWRRWAYGSGEPEWLEPPEWFLEKHPWLRREPAGKRTTDAD